MQSFNEKYSSTALANCLTAKDAGVLAADMMLSALLNAAGSQGTPAATVKPVCAVTSVKSMLSQAKDQKACEKMMARLPPPSNITRDCPLSLLIAQGTALPPLLTLQGNFRASPSLPIRRRTSLSLAQRALTRGVHLAVV